MIKMYIDNEEVVCKNLIEIKEEMLTTSSTILNNCYPKSWEETHDYVNNFYYPKDYSQCLIYHDNELIFCGVVKNTGKISLNPREPKFCSLEILDYKTFLSEGKILDFVIDNKTILESIQLIINEISDYGFVLGNVEIYGANDTIGAYNTQNKSAYDVFQYIAEISSSKWFTRMIDKDTIAIDFYDPDFMTKETEIEYTQSFFEEHNIQDISFNYSTADYRNKQSLISNQVFGSIDYKETLIGSGYTREFITSTPIGNITSILVNGIEASFSTMNDKELGIDTDFYYKPTEARFISNDSMNIYPAGTIIGITYTPIIEGRQVVSNIEEINRINQNTGRNGVIERYESRNDVLSSDELLQIAQTYIKYKGYPEINLTIKTYQDNLYNIGSSVYFNAPINELKKWYMVKSKTTQIYASGDNTYEVFYVYTLTSSYNSEKAINWFDNQRNKAKGNISAGEYITRNIDIEASANIIWENLIVEEITITNDNTLNNSLNAPFIQ